MFIMAAGLLEYEAKLNTNAVIGAQGNLNTAYLEFSNNPYGEGTGNPATLNEIYITVPADSKITPDEFTVGQDAGKLTGVVSTNVMNQAGTQLPTTGGMGTTIFYVLGSVLVFGAVVLLVTKKRMSAAA